ncbi:hypothetical protein SLA2020_264170 [Shorea laevis]
MGGVNGRCRQPKPHFAEEDKFSVEDEPINPFVGRNAKRECPFVPSNAGRWESKFKIDKLKFQSCLQLEEFLDWVATVEEVLDFKEVQDD